MRLRPSEGLNSLVWLLWHMARTEDVAINVIVAGSDQVLDAEWARRMNPPWRIIGTGMTDSEVGELTARADVPSVRAYRSAVGIRTRHVVQAPRPGPGGQPVAGGGGRPRAASPVVRPHRPAVGTRTRQVVEALRPGGGDEPVAEDDIGRAAAAGAFRDWDAGQSHPWLGWSRADQIASSALRHNAVHI